MVLRFQFLASSPRLLLLLLLFGGVYYYSGGYSYYSSLPSSGTTAGTAATSGNAGIPDTTGGLLGVSAFSTTVSSSSSSSARRGPRALRPRRRRPVFGCAASSSESQQPHQQHQPATAAAAGHPYPRHVGIICDGNGRWAAQQGLSRGLGHAEGGRQLYTFLTTLLEHRQRQQEQQHPHQEHPLTALECVTVYAFSTENWTRSSAEIRNIYTAIEVVAHALLSSHYVAEMSVQLIGKVDDPRIPHSCRTILAQLVHTTAKQQQQHPTNTKLTLCLAINYGGRSDITRACQQIATVVQTGALAIDEITEHTISQYLSTSRLADLPSPVVGVAHPENSANSTCSSTSAALSQSRSQSWNTTSGTTDDTNRTSINTNNSNTNTITTSTTTSTTITTGRTSVDPDLILRTGGESRLSNFLVWESAYAELYVCDVLWPDFTYETTWQQALQWYTTRQRNFGGRHDNDTTTNPNAMKKE